MHMKFFIEAIFFWEKTEAIFWINKNYELN